MRREVTTASFGSRKTPVPYVLISLILLPAPLKSPQAPSQKFQVGSSYPRCAIIACSEISQMMDCSIPQEALIAPIYSPGTEGAKPYRPVAAAVVITLQAPHLSRCDQEHCAPHRPPQPRTGVGPIPRAPGKIAMGGASTEGKFRACRRIRTHNIERTA